MVDNNSSDRTEKIVREFASRGRLPIKYLFESKQGKSHALNQGISKSTGDTIAFIDDDCLAHKDWLWSLTKIFHSDPQVIGVGGRILPVWNTEKPSWLDMNEMPGPIVCFDMGDEFTQSNVVPFGANMAFRKTAFLNGLFRSIWAPMRRVRLVRVAVGRIRNSKTSSERRRKDCLYS